jgi:hypothetical protein
VNYWRWLYLFPGVLLENGGALCDMVLGHEATSDMLPLLPSPGGVRVQENGAGQALFGGYK